MKNSMILGLFCMTFSVGASAQKTFEISKVELKNKIMGGWAGQTIGVTFGGPMEFRYNGTIINDYQPVPWYDGYLKKSMLENPGLYDDLYMDLTFVEVFEREGLDAPIESHAKAYANAGYALWHANQAGRYNIQHGIMPPLSGFWKNNPHADCIDYQIECDFAGLMSPAMPNVASTISNRIGHIMNYGDGFYGGVYLGACYTLAFNSNNIEFIVNEALKAIPKESNYYKCIADVINWHKLYPQDWEKTWFEVQKKWTNDIGCPDGVYAPFNIDATVNSAYVVIGLLYGQGDFTKTMEITTRCGQDADCNPSSAGGILGTMIGYDKIPAYWKKGLKEAENIEFKYTSTSLNKVYEMGFRHAIRNISNHGGKEFSDYVSIIMEEIIPVKYEESFTGMYPNVKININQELKGEYVFSFEGTGFVVRGETARWASLSKDIFNMEVFVDGKKYEVASLPVAFLNRRHELTWNYSLPFGKHKVKLKLLNEIKGESCKLWDVIVYSEKPTIQTTDQLYRFKSN